MPTIAESREKIEKLVGIDRKKDEEAEWVKKALEDLRKSSGAKQIAVGAISGWTSGFIFAKFGRTAATAVGGTVLLLHFAQQYGYIKIDWNRVNRDVKEAKREVRKRAEKDLPEFVERLRVFMVQNVLLAGGFGGGFLLGIASA